MKVIAYRSFGSPDVLRLEDVPEPQPQGGEILVRNSATTVSAAETAARKGKGFARLYFGLRRPRFPILGSTFAGEVLATGSGTRFSVGDRVFGSVGPRFGALAEVARVTTGGAIAAIPPNLSFAEAAAVFDGALTALPFLRDSAELKPGQRILVNGASGAVGTAAVQLAKHFGAEVTAVCSRRNHDLVRSLGADTVIDYTAEDFRTSGRTYDVIFDAIGKSSYAKCKGSLTANGRYLTTVPSLGILARTLVTRRARGRRGAISFTGLRPAAAVAADLEYIRDLAATGAYVPVIDGIYPLEQTAEAHRYVDTERKRGSVVVTID
ncbi:NAD(P)-dependent alcohol dehydrogenase [Lysobacter korlensis]|uniref:NAD(P)-dependent alcohol dehydrogenase n=1 Tax=Lysobacter korlensis TaxID=553636 RepID=A0ABV6RRH5_9GAMM